MAYFKAKTILVKEQQWYYLTDSWMRDKGVHTFYKVICPKVNTNEGLEFELAYNNVAVQHVSPDTIRTL